MLVFASTSVVRRVSSLPPLTQECRTQVLSFRALSHEKTLAGTHQQSDTEEVTYCIKYEPRFRGSGVALLCCQVWARDSTKSITGV